MDKRPELDETGARFARDLADSSIVARVALAGYGAGWPDEHVALAVRNMNSAGTLLDVSLERRRVARARVETDTAPELESGLGECAHGYIARTCPDCDVPSYWPAVLDTAPETDVDTAERGAGAVAVILAVAMAVAVSVFGTMAIGRALDVASRDYVLVPNPSGAGLVQCARYVSRGHVYLDECSHVAP